MVDELIREITKPAGGRSAAAKTAARERLLAAAEAAGRANRRKRRRIGHRGVAVLVALLVVPAGVAVATELTKSEDEVKALADCPELEGAVAAKGWPEPGGLQLLECPTGDEVGKTLSLLAILRQQRAALETKTESNHVSAVGVDEGGPWSLDGIAGPIDSSEPIKHRTQGPDGK
jgi:hypothetical protein